MWIKHIFLALVGMTSGFSASAGTFAFIIMIGVVPRMVGKSNTAGKILAYENAIIAGGILGNISSVFLNIRIPFGRPLLILFGLAAGIFVGCIAVALAEILKAFPIMFRRMNVKSGLAWVMVAMALGKLSGSFFYFFSNMASG